MISKIFAISQLSASNFKSFSRSLKSVHFKNTVTQSSFCSKLLSFLIIHQLTLFWFQLKMIIILNIMKIAQLWSWNKRTLEPFYLTVGQKNFGNKIPKITKICCKFFFFQTILVHRCAALGLSKAFKIVTR